MIIQKPCLVETTQGFSVSYKNHLLYSKYNPAKNIIKKIQETQLLPGSVILCLSPVLPHGIKELIAQLPQDCIIILCEKEAELYEFSKARYADTDLLSDQRLFYPAPVKLFDLPQWIYSQNKDGRFRRIIYFDCSAGSQLNADFYKALIAACTDSIMTFWKNRVTLQKFGRKYCMNFFKNLYEMKKTRPIESYLKSVKMPIICFGAGESTDYFFENNVQLVKALSAAKKSFFILCADSALPALLERGIEPDGVFIEEVQNIILKCFIGSSKYKHLHVFAGLSSISALRTAFSPKQISYFFTQFTQADFIARAEMAGCLPAQNPAFGSVGLTMVYYALQFRKDAEVPVYVCGLDFSYSAGRTHTRGTPQHKNKLIAQTKLKSLYDFNSSYNPNAFEFTDKEGNKFYTSQILSGYAQMFRQFFGATKNLFDAGTSGIPLSLPGALDAEGKMIYNAGITGSLELKNCKNKSSEAIEKYLSDEKNALIRLRDLLTTEQGLSKEELQAQITELAQGREYLFLHYPDGCTFRYEQSFLNRIRTEIEFFLRIL